MKASTTPVPSGSAPAAPSYPTAKVVTLAFAGDIHFEGPARNLLRDGRPLARALAKVGRADLFFANLETAVGYGGSRMPGKQFTFKAPPSALAVLKAAGIDAVSMSNNHAADFGDGVFRQTLQAKQAGPLPIVGIGVNAHEAFTPLEVTVHGVRVAVLASSQVPDLTGIHHAATDNTAGIAANLRPTMLREAVRRAAASHDVVVVIMHWGTERAGCADPRQRRTAADLTEAGADIVVGGHAHRPQGAGWLGSSYVGYGLGDFVWYHNAGTAGQSGVLTVTIDTAVATTTSRAPEREARAVRTRPVVSAADWTPMRIGDDGVPRVATDSSGRSLLRAWAQSTGCSGLRTAAR